MKLLGDYSSVDTDGADAVLDLAIESIGYATEHPMFSRHWRPASQILVALVDTRSGAKLYSDKFMYGYHNPLMSGTDIEAPTTYHFKDKEALFADSDKLVSGIRHSVEAVAQEIEKNLHKSLQTFLIGRMSCFRSRSVASVVCIRSASDRPAGGPEHSRCNPTTMHHQHTGSFTLNRLIMGDETLQFSVAD